MLAILYLIKFQQFIKNGDILKKLDGPVKEMGFNRLTKK